MGFSRGFYCAYCCELSANLFCFLKYAGYRSSIIYNMNIILVVVLLVIAGMTINLGHPHGRIQREGGQWALPEKSQKCRVSLKYWSGSTENHEAT